MVPSPPSIAALPYRGESVSPAGSVGVGSATPTGKNHSPPTRHLHISLQKNKHRVVLVFCFGGGERWRKKVDNLGDFLKNLPRKEVEVPGLAFSVVVIGRLELKRIEKMNKA